VGLPEELSNAQGRLVWRATYKTWGNTATESWDIVDLDGGRVHELDKGDRPTEEARQQNLRFQGQYLDRDTGLHYNTFRYYDPDIGRFISPDPIGLQGGLNLGSYGPNPISWIDPWGLVNPTVGARLGSDSSATGVYRFIDNTGRPYIGSTVDQSFGERLSQHVGTGKLPPGSIDTVQTINMNGSSAQEIHNVEASEIARNGGRASQGGATSNVRRPPNTGGLADSPLEAKKPSRFGKC
jgi:RHS repeat-associated protein